MTLNLDSLTVLDESAGTEATTAEDGDEAGFGCLETARGGLPLRRLAVNGRITGLLYRLIVIQEFINAYAEPLEATYIFPLPVRAGVTRFRLRVGERLIEGVLKERGQARAEYDQAIRDGHRAAIAEEERPDVFTVRAGNIPPGEAVSVELELAGPLAFADGEATFRFPLVVAPRYIPGLPLEGEAVGQGVAWDTDAVPDASRISPPILLPGQPNPVHLSLRMELDSAGLPLTDLRTSLHTLRLGAEDGNLRVVELAPGTERLDRDFILRFRVGGDGIHTDLSLYRSPDGEATALLTVIPPTALPTALRPRDVVVVLDRSGSMEGWKMAAARRAAGRLLDTLTERDRFGLILFDNQLEEPAPSSGHLVAATDRNRFRAVEFLARVEARGGTEIAPALHRALRYFADSSNPDRERIILFVTDGQVGNEDQLLREVQQQARHCRIFTVGIDRAVNVALLERLASYGGGHCELVESEDRLDEVLRAVHRRLGAPLLTDLRIEPALEAMAPDRVDLFPGVPVRLGGRWSNTSPSQVTVTARTADGQPFQHILTPVETTEAAVRTLWARARVLDLEHQFIASHQHNRPSVEEITDFSIRYGVLCRFTAFVAVDRSETINPGGETLQVTQAVELPHGWAMPAVAASAPPTALSMKRCYGTAPQLMESLDFLGIPAFLRRGPQVLIQETGPQSPPAWFTRLENAVNASVWDTSAILAAMREALIGLKALGDVTSDVTEEGERLVQRLENEKVVISAMRKRLLAWLGRVRQHLESPPKKRRQSWWK